ncbi:MAG: 4Fe-4S binding protein [Candidatus Cloacimonetes bacterium]|nr:4Fe-4S binding protein [Candidatus Cloacimonadota bacterium]
MLLVIDILPSGHLLCPYAVVCFGMLTLHGIFTFILAMVSGLIISMASLFIGRKFCSYICFLGTLQEYIYRFNRKYRYKQIIPQKLHKILSQLKYVVLVLTAYLAFSGTQFIYMRYCPVLRLAHPYHLTLSAALFFLILLIGCLFIERFWCRYLCPYAALMNLWQYLGKLLGVPRKMIIRNLDSSLDCRNCKNYCPMHLDLSSMNIISSVDCIHCLRCVRTCFRAGPGKEACLYQDDL